MQTYTAVVKQDGPWWIGWVECVVACLQSMWLWLLEILEHGTLAM